MLPDRIECWNWKTEWSCIWVKPGLAVLAAIFSAYDVTLQTYLINYISSGVFMALKLLIRGHKTYLSTLNPFKYIYSGSSTFSWESVSSPENR